MEKRIEKIVINTEGIDVVSILNGVCNVTQLNLESRENEVQEIFERYNLETGIIYHYDEKIIRALEENKEQITEYIETCRRASYPTKKVDVPDTIPEIEYDLRDLKNSFPDIEDEDLRKMRQIEMYRKAKEVLNILRGKATLKMRMLDRAYFSVQDLLQNRSRETMKALNPGKVLKTTAHQAFVEQYAVTRDGTEEQKAQEAMGANQNQQEKETEVLAK